MIINIYQINRKKDDEGFLFKPYSYLKEKGVKQPNPKIYDRVFFGYTRSNTLEEIFEEFNLRLPFGFVGHSLSTSDIVEIVESDSIEKGYYYCDRVGFQKTNFDISQKSNFWFNPDFNGKVPSDSMLINSNTEVAVLVKDGYMAKVDVVGEVNVIYNPNGIQNDDNKGDIFIKTPSEFPEELKALIKHNPMWMEDSRIEVINNNWFELTVYKDGITLICDGDVVDIENYTVEEMEKYLLEDVIIPEKERCERDKAINELEKAENDANDAFIIWLYNNRCEAFDKLNEASIALIKAYKNVHPNAKGYKFHEGIIKLDNKLYNFCCDYIYESTPEVDARIKEWEETKNTTSIFNYLEKIGAKLLQWS